MAEIVNLRRARKAAAREAAAAEGARKRLQHGAGKAEKEGAAAAARLLARRLDQAKRGGPEESR